MAAMIEPGATAAPFLARGAGAARVERERYCVLKRILREHRGAVAPKGK